ncbi:ABC transporter ATP-binding protein [Isoptericola sp. b490]|uniref:ABC transporter ATP-binding protein n=1 Tax=Actinotalea lenta TaxID=3064654 RepID=UPI002712B2BA|nr:ABC transporter ATP-binding protein [Isoptericola sp. b490]MDO8121144.1 ABC transporter ATP-binding protein [Isoptericola sp. b490]
MTALVSLEGIARTYRSGATAVVAVQPLTATVTAGDRIAITGPSGSGKSTLLHLIAGLERPSAGGVAWPGLRTVGRVPAPGEVGLVFQGPSLLPPLTAAENVALPLVIAGVAPAAARARAEQAMVEVGVADIAGQLPEELSGGQAQRVAIARVVAARPRLVLADEPTGQLDHATGAHVLDVLLAAADAIDAAVVLTTHDPAVADRLTSRWTMRDGRCHLPDRPAEGRDGTDQGAVVGAGRTAAPKEDLA